MIYLKKLFGYALLLCLYISMEPCYAQPPGDGVRSITEVTYGNVTDNLLDTTAKNLRSIETTYFNPNGSVDAVEREEFVDGLYKGYHIKGEPIKPRYLIRRELKKYNYDEDDSLVEIHFFRIINLNKAIQGIEGVEEWVKTYTYPNENTKIVKYYDNQTYDALIASGEKKVEALKPIHDLFGTYKMALKTEYYVVSNWTDGWTNQQVVDVQTGESTNYKEGHFTTTQTEVTYQMTNGDTTYKYEHDMHPIGGVTKSTQWSTNTIKKDTTQSIQVMSKEGRLDTLKVLYNGRLIDLKVVDKLDSFSTTMKCVTKDSIYPCMMTKRDSLGRIILDKQYMNLRHHKPNWSEKRYVYDEQNRIIEYTDFNAFRQESVFRTYNYE